MGHEETLSPDLAVGEGSFIAAMNFGTGREWRKGITAKLQSGSEDMIIGKS